MQPTNGCRRVEGNVAIVTGANGGLGSAIARSLGLEGAKVALGVRRGREMAEKVETEIRESGGEAYVATLDVSSPESIQTFTSECYSRYGPASILVNTAGRIDPADTVRFEEINSNDWDKIFEIDVKGTMLMCQAVVPHMKEVGSGSIINFSGSYGNGVNQDNMVNSVCIPFCAAKGAVRAFTASLARDLAPMIRVNAISPGPIEANWEEDWGISKEHMDEALSMTLLGRLGRPEEIAESAMYLASSGSGYMTGQNLLVDAGWTLTG